MTTRVTAGAEPPVWRTASKQEVHVLDMTDEHVRNARGWVSNILEDDERDAAEAAFDNDGYQAMSDDERARYRRWIVAFDDELGRRSAFVGPTLETTSSYDSRLEAICRTKIRHKSKAAAREAARRLARDAGRGGVYECRVCGHWHATKASAENVRRHQREDSGDRRHPIFRSGEYQDDLDLIARALAQSFLCSGVLP